MLLLQSHREKQRHLPVSFCTFVNETPSCLAHGRCSWWARVSIHSFPVSQKTFTHALLELRAVSTVLPERPSTLMPLSRSGPSEHFICVSVVTSHIPHDPAPVHISRLTHQGHTALSSWEAFSQALPSPRTLSTPHLCLS